MGGLPRPKGGAPDRDSHAEPTEEFRSLIAMLQPEVADQLRVTAAGTSSTAFRRAAAPVYLRRNLDEVATELPDVIEVDEWEDLSQTDQAVYRDAVASGNFMAMRRAAFVDTGSAKLERLLQIVEESVGNGRRVIVFSFFLDVLKQVETALSTRVFGPITGAVSSAKRQAMVDEFSGHPEPGVLLAQITAGGEGLNIQAASVVVLCEPQIKPSMEQQAIGRVRRLGQTRTVQVHRLLAANTVDQRMLELLGQKQHLFDTYIRDSVLLSKANSQHRWPHNSVVRSWPQNRNVSVWPQPRITRRDCGRCVDLGVPIDWCKPRRCP